MKITISQLRGMVEEALLDEKKKKKKTSCAVQVGTNMCLRSILEVICHLFVLYGHHCSQPL